MVAQCNPGQSRNCPVCCRPHFFEKTNHTSCVHFIVGHKQITDYLFNLLAIFRRDSPHGPHREEANPAILMLHQLPQSLHTLEFVRGTGFRKRFGSRDSSSVLSNSSQ